MTAHAHAASIPRWISPERFEPYLHHAGGDPSKACELYEWSAELTSAAFQTMHYTEVILRNAIDGVLHRFTDESRSGIPWFLKPLGSDVSSQEHINRDVDVVRQRLRKENPRRETRAQIMAGLSFGFWANMLNTRYEQLWRDAVRKAFPNSSGRRKDVATSVFTLNNFRNRLAHHDSLLAVDVPFRISQMIEVAGWVDGAAADWLRATDRAVTVHTQRPAPRNDTVVVAARGAWPLYVKVRAYVCQAGRSFQPVEYLAFYADRAVQPEIAAIHERVDNVEWTDAESRRLRSTGDARDRRIAEVIDQSRAGGWTDGRYQVFLLSAPGDSDHRTLRSSVPHQPPPGRGRAFTQAQRYTVKQRIVSARSTADL